MFFPTYIPQTAYHVKWYEIRVIATDIIVCGNVGYVGITNNLYIRMAYKNILCFYTPPHNATHTDAAE